MKEQILKVAQDLEKGTITEDMAKSLLLGLFGVSSLQSLTINNVSKMLDKVSKETWVALQGDEHGWKEWYSKRNNININNLITLKTNTMKKSQFCLNTAPSVTPCDTGVTLNNTVKHSFVNFGYDFSTDYKTLWDLIQSGRRIPAWIVYTDEYEEPIWDLVEVKNIWGKPNDYSIGTRGIGYEGAKTFESFEGICKKYSLHYVCPQI